jgi:hypothetical protein
MKRSYWFSSFGIVDANGKPFRMDHDIGIATSERTEEAYH